MKKITNVEGKKIEFSLTGVPFEKAVLDFKGVMDAHKNGAEIIQIDDAIYRVAKTIDNGYHVYCRKAS